MDKIMAHFFVGALNLIQIVVQIILFYNDATIYNMNNKINSNLPMFMCVRSSTVYNICLSKSIIQQTYKNTDAPHMVQL